MATYSGMYNDHGTEEGLSQQDAGTPQGKQNILDFVAEGLDREADPISLTVVPE